MTVTVYYLQMLSKPVRTAASEHTGALTVVLPRPSVRYYRYLYDSVGEDYNWRIRRGWSDEQLLQEIDDPRVKVMVLMVQQIPAGLAHLDFRQHGEVELVQFGIMQEYFGQGLGKFFINQVIDYVWQQDVGRFWLHTCTRDHQHALPNYLKSGFDLYKEEVQ